MEQGRPGGFSLQGRSGALGAMARREVDLLVLGGGITGAGVARDAALRGLSVALVEAGDFAGGTSGRSSRLVHGGLRYLRQGQLHLVWEACHERSVLLAIAPHLVRPVEFLLPVYRGIGPGPWATALGLRLYDLMAGRHRLPGRRRLTPRQVLALEPGLNPRGLRGGVLFRDGQVDDARLVLETLRSAWRAGALVANYARALALLSRGPRVVGARVRDEATGAEVDVRARMVVSALGPWTDSLGELGARGGHYLSPTKGIHLVLRPGALGIARALALWNPSDGRLFFVLPWDGLTIVGTTDTPYASDPREAVASGRDVQYLLGALDAYFPSAVGPGDVQATYAGVRPLLRAPGRQPSARSREHRIVEPQPGLLVVAGGKLTTHRAMAAEAVERAAASLGLRVGPSRTREEPLIPPPPGGLAALEASLGLPPDDARHLVRAHGGEARTIASVARARGLDRRIAPGLPYIEAEVLHAAEGEMVVHLEDFLCRRTGIFLEDPDRGRRAAEAVVPLLGRSLGWGEGAASEELRAYRDLVERSEAWRGERG